MKSVVMLWEACLAEAGDQHHVRTDRDLAYARERIEQEGIEFLAITLPAFEREILRGLSIGRVESGMFPGFRKRGVLPAFMQDFLLHLFDADGLLRSDADPSVLRSMRQVCLLVGKLEVPVTREREDEALAAYVRTDRELEGLHEDDLVVFRTVARNLLAPFLAVVEARLWSGEWQPRYSSGATADRESYNSRFAVRTWTERLQGCFPWWDDLAFSAREILLHADDFSVLARDMEPPCRVSTVPKTMKGPRIIAMEPSWMMYCQQGILHVMTDVLAQPRFADLANFFGWHDQEPNRRLARIGSYGGSYATIDLSEASDRVSLELAEALLSSTPFLRKCVMAARTERAQLPRGGAVLDLQKFASMGSALCFPIESMVFFTIQSIAWAEHVGMDPSALRVCDLPRMRTYGDDLIIPVRAAQNLIQRLEAYGLKVNSAKSYTTGEFRESCGADWFRGHDVSVFRLRHVFPESDRHLEHLDSAVEFHNHAYEAGWIFTAAAAEGLLGLLNRYLPRVPVGTNVLALWSWEGPFETRVHPALHRIQYRAFKVRTVKPKDALNEYGALKKWHQPHGEVPREPNHLERDGRSQFAGVTIGWTSEPYESLVQEVKGDLYD